MLNSLISHYRITGKIGAGGMGVVYEAEDTRLRRKVALKFLPEDLGDDADAARRFRREAETVAALSHPHICIVYDIGEHEGRGFIAMQRLDGVNLKTYLNRKHLETTEILHIALQVTEALEAAHASGIVHRDIKPGNIVVSDRGHATVLNFGLARRFQMDDGLGPDGSTIPGRPLGTAYYMAPERILQLPLDPRCDLFSLGVVIYEMATGRLPFAGESPADTVTSVLDKDLIPLTTLAPNRPAELWHVVRRLLEKRAADRYQSALELRAALEGLRRAPKRSLWAGLIRG